MDRIQNPYLKNQSSGLSGVFGGQSASPYGNNPMGSLPDLKQSKRESKWPYRLFLCLTNMFFATIGLEAELLSDSAHASTVGRRGGRVGANGSVGVNSNRGRY